jgi:Bacterial PH domain
MEGLDLRHCGRGPRRAGVVALLLTIGCTNIWVVAAGRPAVTLDDNGVTVHRVLERAARRDWADVADISEGKRCLLVKSDRLGVKPLVIGYDWIGASPEELRRELEARLRIASRYGRPPPIVKGD